jgi:hypothetical protein
MRAAVVLVMVIVITHMGGVAARTTMPRRVASAEIEPLVRKAISDALPANIQLKQVRLPPALSLGEGELQVALAAPLPSRTGMHPVTLLVSVSNREPIRLFAIVELTAVTMEHGGVTRGATVRVIVQQPGIIVATRGIAQANAQNGEAVTILAEGGRKILSARVIDAQTVEVSP